MMPRRGGWGLSQRLDQLSGVRSTLEIILDPADTPDERAERDEMLGAVAAEFASLPEALRSILQLRIVDGLSMKEASAALDVPVGTLEKRVRRGVETLRERFERRQLAGGITVAGAIRRSGSVVNVQAAQAVTLAAAVRVAVGILALVLGVGGLIWAIERATAAPTSEIAELDPLRRSTADAELDSALAGIADTGTRARDAHDDAPGAAGVEGHATGAPTADPIPEPAAADTYVLHVDIVLDGKPVEDWECWPLYFEPHAQPAHEPVEIKIEPEAEPGAKGRFTYIVPRDPRGKWGGTLHPADADGASAPSYVRFVIDPLAALTEEPDGSRVLEVKLQSRSLKIEDGMLGRESQPLDMVQLQQQLQAGVWAMSVLDQGDTGDDIVVSSCFAGPARLARIGIDWVEPGEWSDLDPHWEGWVR